MRTDHIRNGLKSHLYNYGAALSGRPWPVTNWPNVDTSSSILPRFEITIDNVDRTGGTLKGNEVLREIGFFAVTVCVSLGIGEDDAFDYIEDVLSLFPEGTTLYITGGKIVIPQPPQVRMGYPDPDGSCYRVPILIRYAATAA